MPFVDLEPVIREHGDWDKLSPIVQGTFQHLELWVPDTAEEDEQEVYIRALKGHCMTCDGPLSDLTMLAVNKAGIVMVYCCGQCYTDMQLVGWIEEQYQDLVDAIKFRGGKVDPDGA